ncbi:MAG: hypothetical protein AB3N11_13410 [Arenibacterium sp.]
MLRLVRTIVLLMIAFVAGLLFERDRVQTACTAAAGEWRAGTCLGSEISHD